ncbi:Major facilitator superfamily domain, general substrate transporter [Cordyceps fumosorosea ARSEF 2679]|uniref:Major facilitator superfamily domain, general substrate transporter n=1 Tax=Cordyceps fumosorosea (strain ARSEF 2679) TaxID=1081104 RepID=A0A167P7K7_CORFA|nr:Major facilitator superfamily domain, general substrate transporter [Cordyceps fumosorosea ARSEF 2679]OAA56373.1 Major facilitator superfamily domain, general substrate transporter [Cordyceps fumosorosea ARSEF 2679]
MTVPDSGSKTAEDVEKTDRIICSSAAPVAEDDDGIPDPGAERRLLLKCDLRLIPILGTLYLVSFLDRSNIANARLFGLEKDLAMPSTGFNNCLWIFYVPFILVEVPSNLFMSLNKIKPNQYLAGAMFILGVVSMCQGLVGSYGGLLACRFIMGIMEAALPPGAALLIGQYYKRHEYYLRFSYFFSFALLGSAFSGLLAYAIEHMNGLQNYAAWRWVFILEGLLTISFALVAWLVIPGFPSDATFLAAPERALLLSRLRLDRSNSEDTKLSSAGRALLDWKVWAFTLLFFCADMGAASVSAFTPTILHELGWTASRAQVMSIPVWMFSIAGTLAASYASGRLPARWPLVLLGAALALVGWCLQYAQVRPAAVRYFALYLVALGSVMQFPLLLGWLSGNVRGRARQAVAGAVQLGVGNCANFVASNVFITRERPRYPTGFATGVGIATLGIVTLVLVTVVLAWENGRLQRRQHDAEDDGGAQDKYRYLL